MLFLKLEGLVAVASATVNHQKRLLRARETPIAAATLPEYREQISFLRSEEAERLRISELSVRNRSAILDLTSRQRFLRAKAYSFNLRIWGNKPELHSQERSGIELCDTRAVTGWSHKSRGYFARLLR